MTGTCARWMTVVIGAHLGLLGGCAPDRSFRLDLGASDLKAFDLGRPADLTGVDGPQLPDLTTPPGEWSEYWILGQLPKQSTVFLYSRDGGQVTFGGTIAQPRTVELPADTFVSYNIGQLGYAAQNKEWYFLEARRGDVDGNGGHDFMMSADRVVVTDATQHGDALHSKPGHNLDTHYYFAWSQSGSRDDQLVFYAPEPARVTVRALSNHGAQGSRTENISGIHVTGSLDGWLGIDDGYFLEVTSDKPIAVALFDELGIDANSPDGSGYYFGWIGQHRYYDEYMHIAVPAAPNYAYHSFYTPQATTLSYFAAGHVPAKTAMYAQAKSEIVLDSTTGYNPAAPPYLVHYKATAGVADSNNNGTVTPVETETRPAASYMGWNASLAQLEIYAPNDTSVQVYDGRNNAIRTTLHIKAGAISITRLDSIGFAANQPFLVAVAASVSVFQDVRVSTYLLRQYPADVGPIIQ